ncbi:MAG: hypothetical protein MUE87_03235 [Methanothrix sp.]|jgi:uncharacterized protein YdeI (BOF family)|nr:hypothetical protein [Methanothrix sp.]
MRLNLITGSLLLVLMASALWPVQASDDEPAELGQEETRISDILENATAYNGSMVVVEGAIELECAAGCWFIVNDGTGSIFVDILPNNFAIPQESGEDAKVYGEVTIKNNESQIIGKMVKIGGEVYQ